MRWHNTNRLTISERAIWPSLQSGDIATAMLAAGAIYDAQTPMDAIIYAHVIAATPTNGHASLRSVAQALQSTNLRPDRALDTVTRLCRALHCDDWPEALKHTTVLRTACPWVSRSALFAVLTGLHNAGAGKCTPTQINSLFNHLDNLIG